MEDRREDCWVGHGGPFRPFPYLSNSPLLVPVVGKDLREFALRKLQVALYAFDVILEFPEAVPGGHDYGKQDYNEHRQQEACPFEAPEQPDIGPSADEIVGQYGQGDHACENCNRLQHF